MLVPVGGTLEFGAVAIVELAESRDVQVDAELLSDRTDPLLQRIASPALESAEFQQVLSQVVSNLGGSPAVVLAGHMEMVVVRLEALANTRYCALFQA